MNASAMLFVLWVCASLPDKPGKCRFEPVETFLSLKECKAREFSKIYIKEETRCLPHTVRLYGNGTVK